MTFHRFQPGTAEHEQALQLRGEILRAPLGLSLSPDDLAQDAACFHLGGFEDGELQAVLLLCPVDKNTVKMRQVAVRPERQGTGIGAGLVRHAEALAREQGFTTMIAHARGTAVGFYRRLGYEVVGDEFLEQTIPHQLVTKELSRQP